MEGDGSRVEPDYYSVALIGSSGGGTATLGHTDPVELLSTVHRELLRVRDIGDGEGDGCGDVDGDGGGGESQGRRACVGLSHAIFVSLCDGSGFDSVKEEDWRPSDDKGGPAGPTAALYAVGFERDAATGAWWAGQKRRPFRVTLVDEGPLAKINTVARAMDVSLGWAISQSMSPNKCGPKISAMICLSSEPTVVHAASLKTCAALKDGDFPIVGSGGTSLSRIASLYDLRIVGNSGGSVASTTLTKARGWAMGLAKEWGMAYDANFVPESDDDFPGIRKEPPANAQTSEISSAPLPTLKSILEAALPAFLFVCIALRVMDACEGVGVDNACSWARGDEQVYTPTSMIKFALRHIVLGTTCCVLAATSRSPSSSSEDQSTLLMSAAIAGVLASASASQPQSAFSTHYNGGSALACLLSGALIPAVLSKISGLCHRYHVTATMTNILCGGGVGMFVGVAMHLSGIAQSLSLATGVIRSLLRWRRVIPPEQWSNVQLSTSAIPSLLPRWIENGLFPTLQYVQGQWQNLMSQAPALLGASSIFEAIDGGCSPELLPIPTGLGFLCGCFFVYGSKVGLYHSLFLPAILLEMDSAGSGEEASLLGAIDECTLVIVCAGICAGNLLLPPSSNKSGQTEKKSGAGLASLSWQALKTNVLCGDFIEAAYPSMERSKVVNWAAYLAAGLSTEVILQRRVLSTAYLPLPLAIWISNDGLGMTIACSVAFAVSFLGTVASNIVS